MRRRSFLQTLGAINTAAALSQGANAEAKDRSLPKGSYAPGRVPNEYSLLLPGEREALDAVPRIARIHHRTVISRIESEDRTVKPGDLINGWQLVSVASINGSDTAVFEKNVTHQGAIIFITEEGVILRIRKGVGHLENIRPRPINTPQVRFTRQVPYIPGPDRLAEYILNSNEDPCYENVAALGAEYIGYTLIGNEEAGPLRSLFLEADGRSRQLTPDSVDGLWSPDAVGAAFDPSHFLPGEDPSIYRYLRGYSKRTLLHGYLLSRISACGIRNPARAMKCSFFYLPEQTPGPWHVSEPQFRNG